MGENVDKELVIAALMESNEILRTENNGLRNSNRILRTVFRNLRAANESLRRLVDIAKDNDEVFKKWCEGAFDAPVLNPAQGGLPEDGN